MQFCYDENIPQERKWELKRVLIQLSFLFLFFFVFIFYICILLVSLSFRDEIPLEMQTNQSLFVAIKKQVQA